MPRHHHRAAAALALLSAAAATTHEVVWGRLVAHLVGNTAWGVGLTLTIFMAGMGAGSLLGGRLLARGARPRRAYVLAELIIGLGVLGADLALLRGGLASGLLGVAGAAGLAVDIAQALLLLALPALAIGATFPLLLAAAQPASGSEALVTWIYLAGLAGGCGGVLLAALVLAPTIGFDGAALVASAGNLLVALLARLLLPPSAAGEASTLPPDGETGRALRRFAAAGALGLGAQVVWCRVVIPYAGVSAFSFAAVVAVYLLAQAIGMAAGRRLSPSHHELAGAAALGLAPVLALASLAPLGRLGALAAGRPLLGASLIVAAAVGPTALLLGLAQGSALRLLEGEARSLARAAARVSGLGTVASALASALASLVLFALVGPRWTLALLGLPALLVLALERRLRLTLALPLALGALLALRPGPAHFLGGGYDGAALLFADEGVQDTTAVVVKDLPVEPGILRLVANGMSYSGDSLFAQRYMRLLAHLPALAARDRHAALVICVGTGSTAAALLAHPFARVDAVDISPSIRRTLAFFRGVNAGLEEDRRVRLIVEDGYRWLRVTRERYDVITLEPPPPRAPGAAALYSREFYASARARLAPGGVLAQWLPLHDLSGWEAAVIVRTFLDAFPRASLHLAERNEAILLGAADPVALATSSPGRLADERVSRELARLGLAGRDPLAETWVAGEQGLAPLADAPVMRYAWPVVELAPAEREPLDAWAERLAHLRPRGQTAAALLLPAVPGFLRATTGRAREGDRAAVVAALHALWRRDPRDAYAQYMLGYGPHLEARLRDPARPITEEARQLAARLIERQRRSAEARSPR